MLEESSEEGVEFIKNFKDTSKFNYKLEVKLSPEIHLRNYQIEGITWLGFLCKYNLNGALCDDMGLGKTLQVLSLIENEYHKMINDKKPDEKLLPSLIVVPTTLVEHWGFEYQKYFDSHLLNVVLISQKT